MTERAWTTKTLAKQLVAYLKAHPGLGASDSIETLLESLAGSIVEDEVGVSLDVWGGS